MGVQDGLSERGCGIGVIFRMDTHGSVFHRKHTFFFSILIPKSQARWWWIVWFRVDQHGNLHQKAGFRSAMYSKQLTARMFTGTAT